MPRRWQLWLLLVLALAALLFVAWRSFAPRDAAPGAPAPTGEEPVIAAEPLSPIPEPVEVSPPPPSDFPLHIDGFETPVGPPAPPVPRITLTGRVLDAGGAVAAGAGVFVVLGPAGLGTLSSRHAAVCGDDGRFTIPEVPDRGLGLIVLPGPVTSLRSDAVAGRPIQGFPVSVTVGDGQTLDVGDLRLGVPRAIEGTVLDGDGAPYPGVEVTAFTPGSSYVVATTHTRADGRFVLPGLLPGVYRVSAAKPMAEIDIVRRTVEGVEPGGGDVLITLVPVGGVVLAFHPAGDPGRPLPVREGRLERAGATTAMGFGGPRPRTKLRVILPLGRHQLTFTATGFLPVDLGEVEILPDRDVEIDVELRPE